MPTRSRHGGVALAVGVAVLLVTAASQTGLLGAHDFSVVALLGLAGAALCVALGASSGSRAALAGLALSLLPVGMLVVYLSLSDG
jgi:hypothetical protein